MPENDDIDAILTRELKVIQDQLVLSAASCRWRRGRPEIEADDLFQEGVLASFQYFRLQLSAQPEYYSSLSRKELQDKMLRVAIKAMNARAVDILRRTLNRPTHSSIEIGDEISDDRTRNARAAREDLEAISKALSGPSLALYHLILVHGQDDVDWLAARIGRSPSQTYRLLAGIKVAAFQVTGRTASRRVMASVPPVKREPGSGNAHHRNAA